MQAKTVKEKSNGFMSIFDVIERMSFDWFCKPKQDTPPRGVRRGQGSPLDRFRTSTGHHPHRQNL